MDGRADGVSASSRIVTMIHSSKLRPVLQSAHSVEENRLPSPDQLWGSEMITKSTCLAVGLFVALAVQNCGSGGSGILLTWQNPPAADSMTWQEAIDYCDSLTQDGNSDWRLPTISELRSLIHGCPATEAGGSCGVTDGCLSDACCNNDCNGCAPGDGPNGGCYWPDGMQGTCGWYWSSSERDDGSYNAWLVLFYYSYVSLSPKDYNYYVRCVR